jgi:hypothetical protein
MLNAPVSESKHELTYPTSALQPLFDQMRHDISLLRQWLGCQGGISSVPTEVTPMSVLETLEAVIESAEPALRLFLNFPTQRLLAILLPMVREAREFADWLRQTEVASEDPVLLPDTYASCCDRLCAALVDWHNALMLTQVTHDLDARAPEVQN